MSDDLARAREIGRSLLSMAGADPRAAEVYIALAASAGPQDPATARELGLSQSELSALVEDLLRLGLVRHDHAVQSQVVALSPRAALARLTSELEVEVAERTRQLSRVRKEAHEVTAIFEALWGVDPMQLIQLNSSQEVVNYLHRMAGEARTEVCTLVTTRPSRGALAESFDGDRALVDRGVAVRVIYPVAVRNDPALRDYTQRFRAVGAQVRFAPVVPVRAVIYDRSIAVVAAQPDSLAAGAVVVGNPGLLSAVTWTFDLLWDTSEEDTAPATGPEPSRVELEALRLYAQGMKDEAVARRMGVSVRTLRRTIAQLTERLGVSGRFELGALATARGWVRPPRPPE